MKLLTEEKIQIKALSLFVQKGYSGTSLSDIGNDVGIKKQSIYSHFKNKEELFLTIMNRVIDEENYRLSKFFDEKVWMSPEEKLEGYIIFLKDRFIVEADENIKFLLRMVFIPPADLKETVMKKAMTYFDLLEDIVKDSFEGNVKKINVTPEMATLAYLNVFDGLLVELIYVSVESFEVRFNASWEVFKKAVFDE